MARTTIQLPEELKEKIDKDRAENAVETGEVRSRAEWFRRAAREKLGIDYTEDDNETKESKGAA